MVHSAKIRHILIVFLLLLLLLLVLPHPASAFSLPSGWLSVAAILLLLLSICINIFRKKKTR